MIQDQLVEYVSSQMKLGVSRDAIKSALIGVGWQAADVEDTLKKVEGDKAQPVVIAASAQPVMQKPLAQPASSMPMNMPANTPFSKPLSPLASFSPSDIIGGTKSVPSQPVRMNDSISGIAQNPAKSFVDKKLASVSTSAGVAAKMMGGASEHPIRKKNNKIMTVVEVLVIVCLVALSGFLYFQNNTLSSKVNGLSGQSTDVTSQISNLNAQIQTFTTSDANLTAQVASLTAENADLQTNLSFLAIPSAGSATTTTAQVTGVLSVNKSAVYAVTTAYGVKVSVKNSSDAAVGSALAPLIGTTVQLSGTYLVGSALFTVSSINGTSLTQNIPTVPSVSTTTATGASPVPNLPAPAPATTSSASQGIMVPVPLPAVAPSTTSANP